MSEYNPIHELADFIEALTSTGGNVNAALTEVALDSEDLWDAHARGVAAYLQTRELLIASGRLDANANVLAEIRNALIAPNAAWDSHSVPTVNPFALTALRNVADAGDIHELLPPVLGAEELDALKEALEEIREVISAATELPGNICGYLRYLINRCLDILAGEAIDFVALRSITLELHGLGIPTTPHLAQERREKFTNALRRVVGAWFTDFTTSAAAELAANTATKLIGG
ncbi:hypothetical protein [Schaalia hyovaginalis]|uniref:Uncharacterized protein n=1 Tax=Schaalia hyovaginalis TaxID=29316 RepID=A0A923E4Y0_9ACTO|nr:hypothetical protein [Schaalia hyovaginalis]MBB6333659.1 hypothetical protein [Schaalia hyovaginalis]